ncbi:MAG TPA: transketolase, partial [Acidimicrobiia bacterium]|nr:transketolase [Acidimicrobiia bacterium]
RQFRQWGSRTPGHPERGHTTGVEVTTGPLGQGFANAVGMAVAERHLRERFGAEVVDHRVFGICSDGDLQEGVTHEAAALAGHLRLGRLVFVYDDNHITIDGPTELAMSEDVPKRFEAYGWHVVRAGEVSEDLDALERALRDGIDETDRPTLVVLRSHIGFPSPKFTDTAEAHGNPLGADEVAAVKEILGLSSDDFVVPDDVRALYRDAGARGRAAREEWAARRARWAEAQPARADELDACLAGRGLDGWDAKLPSWTPGESLATRVASSDVLTAIFDVVPGLVGGGADLTGNTGTQVKGAPRITPDDGAGRAFHFGIREHGMGAILNGMAFGGLLPFGGTFFVFSDYMRPAVRLAALSRAKVAFVWSHDSVGVGEDGPTHQPVEHLAAARAIPGLRVIRPADANETAAAWRYHIDNDGPTALVLTRQKVPVLEGTAERAMRGVAHGAYVLVDEPTDAPLQLVLVGTGSEVSLCVEARERLAARGVAARVVSMPSWDLFAVRPAADRDAVLPPGVPTLAVEAGASFGWDRWADAVIAIDRFGESAPGDVALAKLGFTVDHVEERAAALLGLGPT